MKERGKIIMRRSSQLNAISYAIAERNRKHALKELQETWKIKDFKAFQKATGYKAGPAAILAKLEDGNKTTQARYEKWKTENE